LIVLIALAMQEEKSSILFRDDVRCGSNFELCEKLSLVVARREVAGSDYLIFESEHRLGGGARQRNWIFCPFSNHTSSPPSPTATPPSTTAPLFAIPSSATFVCRNRNAKNARRGHLQQDREALLPSAPMVGDTLKMTPAKMLRSQRNDGGHMDLSG
jgi:hypothetical protein